MEQIKTIINRDKNDSNDHTPMAIALIEQTISEISARFISIPHYTADQEIELALRQITNVYR